MAILAEIIFEKEKGINKISLVARPAIEVDFLKFAEEHEIKFTINNDLQIVTGPILIPNRNYYRGKDYFGGDESGYVFFSKDTIKKLGIDYIKNAKNSINIEHKDDLQPNDVDLVESWYIESDHDKAYDLGFSKTDCPVGTWMMSQHINNSDLWAEIKNNKYNGFSIQGFLSKNIIGTGLDMKKEYSEDEIANIIVGLCLAETIIEIKITTDDNAKTNIIDTNAPVNIPVGNITGNTNNTGGKVTANANSNISGDTNASTGSTTGSTRQVNGTIDNTTGTTGQTGSTAIKMAKIIKFANQSGSGVTTAEDNQNNLIKGKNKSYVMRAREDSAVTDNDLMKYQLKWNTPEERKKAVEEWKRRQAAPESVQLSQESEKPIIKPIVENNKDNSLLSMTAPRKGESKKDYIPRCVKYLMDKGEAKDNDQAVAMCYSAWGKESKMSFVEKIQDTILTLGMPDNYPNSDVYPNMNNYGGSVQIRRSLDKTSKKKQDDAQSRAINKKKIEEQAQADAKVKADIAINNTLNKLKNKMPAKQLQMGAPMGNHNAARAHAEKESSSKPTTKEIIDKAKESGPEIDNLAKGYAEKYGGVTTDINYKSEASIERKANSDFNGDASKLTDTVRSTVIVDDDKLAGVYKELSADKQFSRVQFQDPEKYAGYSGIITNITTKNGVVGEVQFNTAKMIYAKEKPEDAKRIIGEAKWNEIHKATAPPDGGLGHSFYEKMRVFPKDSQEFSKIADESRTYYKPFATNNLSK